jgi:hypothetical protein
MDVEGIAPSADWRRTLERVLDTSKIGVVVIGPRWIRQSAPIDGSARVGEEDFVYWEVERLLNLGKAIAPVLVDGAALPGESQLPDRLRPLLRFHAPTPLNNANWAVVVRQLVQQIERTLSSQTMQPHR